LAGRIPQHFIDDLLARVDIVDVVNSRLQLKRAGNNLKACCPFHGEKTPSFTVSQNKQFYHCFGCGAHGSAIGFLMEYDGLHFVDAIETLADMIGVEVPREQNGNNTSGAVATQSDNRPLYELMESVGAHFVTELKNSKRAIDYLTQRGLSGETAKRFRIGFARDGYDNLDKAFSGQRKALETTGMLARNDRDNVYARFRDRIMFPIRDRRGRVIGFGGRVIEKQEPKYLNSPETVLFHKSQELYGLYEGRRDAQDQGFALVVEGYMDVVALAEAGIGNAVATLGTSPNQHHCETLFRVVPGIIFCFDGDRAGREAAWRAAQAALPCLRDGRDAHFLFLPDGEDPDSLVAREGADGLNRLISEQKVSIVDYIFDHQSENLNLSELGGKAALVEKMKPLLSRMPEGVYRDFSFRQLEQVVGFPIDQKNLSSSTTRADSKPAYQPTTTKPKAENAYLNNTSKRLSVMRHSILLLLNHPDVSKKYSPAEFTISQELQGAPLLLALLQACQQRQGMTTGSLLEYFRDTEHVDVLQKLAIVELMPDGSSMELQQAEETFVHCLQQLHSRSRLKSASKLQPSQRTGLLSVTRTKH